MDCHSSPKSTMDCHSSPKSTMDCHSSPKSTMDCHSSPKSTMDCHSSPKPIVIDLFCGGGGLSEGLVQAGFEPRVALDFDANALKTYKANHPNTEIIHGDIARACR